MALEINLPPDNNSTVSVAVSKVLEMRILPDRAYWRSDQPIAAGRVVLPREPLALERPGIFTAHDRQQPRLGRIRVLEAVLRFPGPQQAFLDDVLRQRPVAGQPKCETQQIGPQRQAQRLKFRSLGVSAERTFHV